MERPSIVGVVLIGFGIAGTACATAQSHRSRDIAADIRTATGANPRLEAGTFSIPVGISVSDGLSREDAVGIALWNNAAFQASVSQLGFVRADLVDAGLITNPALSLLFPLGPKQLEATLRLPAEFLWERPRRLKAARLSLDTAAQNLVQSGLELAFTVRLAHADLAMTTERERLMTEAANAIERIDALTQSRLRAGDVSQLEARAIQIDAVRLRQDADRVAYDVVVSRERLRLLLGAPADDTSLAVLQPSAGDAACAPPAELLVRARAARPDVRAAEIALEAAAARLGWERSRILQLGAVLDANGEGLEGFELGPGVDVSIPVFNRNQGGTLRAQSELGRASAAYLQLQQQVALDVREASALLAQARDSREAWTARILAPLEANLADAEEAYAAGDVGYLVVLDNLRRLIDGRVRAREIQADEQRAQARVERASGLACETRTEGVQ